MVTVNAVRMAVPPLLHEREVDMSETAVRLREEHLARKRANFEKRKPKT